VRVPLGLLAGWLTLAAAAGTDAAILGARGEDPQVARWSGAVLLGAATVVAGAVLRRSGGAAYPGVLTWGLAGIAARSMKQRRVVPATAAGLAGAALLAVSRRARRRARATG
jgi:hypothetical protein